jgi:hypothetical protein
MSHEKRLVLLRGGRDSDCAGRGPTVDRSDEAVPSSSDCLNEDGLFRRFAQRNAQPLDGGIQAVIEVDERVRRPELIAQFFSGYHISRSLQQRCQ